MAELRYSTSVPATEASLSASGANASPTAPVNYTRKVARLTLARLGARVGLFWIIFISFLAIFAPLLANSFPLLARQNGHWCSPFLAYLTPADVVLQTFFCVAVALAFVRKWSIAKRIVILICVVVASAGICVRTLHPPEIPIYDTYRTGIKNGTITNAVYAPIRYSPDDHQRDDPDARFKPPGHGHLMGTTEDAADMAANMIFAARTAISIGFVATGVAVVLGVIMGGVMGYLGGWVDLVGMRFVEVFESIPALLLLLAFAGVFQSYPHIALYLIMIIIGVLSSFGYAEFIRAEFLSLRDRDFIHAARSTGLPTRLILIRHMLPNGLTPVIVSASFGIAGAILLESSLSFLGVGSQYESDWGNLLDQALGSGGTFFWWLALYPGGAIFLTVLAYNLIGESLRDALDPRLNKMD